MGVVLNNFQGMEGMLSLICRPYFEELKDNTSYGLRSGFITLEQPQYPSHSLSKLRVETLGTPALNDNNRDMITVALREWLFLILYANMRRIKREHKAYLDVRPRTKLLVSEE